MLIRYFEINNEENFKAGGNLIAQTKTYRDAIVPHKSDTLFIGDNMYKVFDVCYCADYPTGEEKNIDIDMIDITLIEEKL